MKKKMAKVVELPDTSPFPKQRHRVTPLTTISLISNRPNAVNPYTVDASESYTQYVLSSYSSGITTAYRDTQSARTTQIQTQSYFERELPCYDVVLRRWRGQKRLGAERRWWPRWSLKPPLSLSATVSFFLSPYPFINLWFSVVLIMGLISLLLMIRGHYFPFTRTLSTLFLGCFFRWLSSSG